MSALGWTWIQEDDGVLPPTPGRQDTGRVVVTQLKGHKIKSNCDEEQWALITR